MAEMNHYRKAEDILRRIESGGTVYEPEFSLAQLRALVAIADELRAIRNELMTIRGIVAAQARDDG